MPDLSHSAAPRQLVVDGHLDLATMALIFGRDLTSPARETRRREQRKTAQATVSLPDLARGNVGLAFATLWVLPPTIDIGVGGHDAYAGTTVQPYETPAEAEAQGLQQLDYYRHLEDAGKVRIIRSQQDLKDHLKLWPGDDKLGIVVLMEGADPIVRPEDVATWFARGVRIVGPAWGRTRYAGGTGAPGGLTPQGRELVNALRECGGVLDISHLADQAFSESMALGPGRIIASHSTARALVPGDRQITDEMIRAVADRDGIIGIPLYNMFLVPDWQLEGPPVRVAEAVGAHAAYVASIAGWSRVAIGSDLDGGFGLQESPEEIDTVADLGAMALAVPEDERAGFLGGNWLRFLAQALPAS